MDWKGVTMNRIVVLLLFLQTGVIPALSQSQYDSLTYSNAPRFSEYGDYGSRYFSGNTERESSERNNQRDFPLEQPSFFMFNKNENNAEKESVTSTSDNSAISTTVSSLIGGEGSYGGLTPPPPPPDTSSTDLQVNEDSRTKYFTNERHLIVPSSLRELEESYIRSLSASSSSVASDEGYGEDKERANTPGVENYSGFIMANRRYIKNNQDSRSISAEQSRRQQHFQQLAQNAPITYGFPLLNEQRGPAAKNSREVAYHRNGGRRKESGKFFPFTQKNNIVPNYPDFSDRPPIPEEPESPPGTEDTIEQATRRPPGNILLPTSQTLQKFGLAQPPLSSPPSVFDPSFPGPIMERGFIPSFGPPTKYPFNKPLKESNPNLLLEHENNRLQQLQSHRHLTQIKSNIPTTSAVPVLRPEFRVKEKENILPDEVGSEDSESDEKPGEGRVYKHISVHVPAEDLDEDISAPKVVKVAKNPEKHIKVIFIKPPDSRPAKTEVEVPANPQQKTLVYVLSESGGTRRPIKLITPTPLKPAPPQVFFLRYTDPHNLGGHRRPGTSTEREFTIPGEGSPERPIKQLASPRGPESKPLRTAPTPVLPTFTTFGSPSPTLAHLQSTLTSPTLYPLTSSNFENTNDINDPTNSRFHGGTTAASSSPPALLPSNSNRHLTALHYTTSPFPSSTVQPQAQIINNDKNQFYHSPNYYSSLYHLYPPPALTSLPNQFPYYNTANIYQQQNHLQSHPLQQHQFYHLGSAGQAASSKLSGGTAENEQSSSIQGLYTVAPYLKSLPGSINFNYLKQNPDGNNLPRTTRNYAMMTYAPTYMPSAAGSDHVPVFTSPAEFIKSLLGDSYKYYNNIGSSNNNTIYTTEYYQFASTPSTATIHETTTTTTTPTPPPPVTTKSPPIHNQPQHHTIPVVLNFRSFSQPDLTAKNHSRDHQSQPITIVISNGGSSYEIDKTSTQFPYSSNNNQPTFATPINPHLMPSFLTTPTPPTTTTSSTTPQSLISWASSTPSPYVVLPRDAPSPTPKQIINLPIVIYEGGTGKNTRFYPNRLANGVAVSSHFDKLFNNFTKSENNYTNEQSAEYNGSGQSDSSSASEEGEDEDSSQLSSGEEEEVQAAYFDSSRSNFNSTIDYLNNHNSTSSPSSSNGGKRGKSRKRVNPALVKPGRRLRKVRKPNRSKKSKTDQQDDQSVQLQSEISQDTRS